MHSADNWRDPRILQLLADSKNKNKIPPDFYDHLPNIQYFKILDWDEFFDWHLKYWTYNGETIPTHRYMVEHFECRTETVIGWFIDQDFSSHPDPQKHRVSHTDPVDGKSYLLWGEFFVPWTYSRATLMVPTYLTDLPQNFIPKLWTVTVPEDIPIYEPPKPVKQQALGDVTREIDLPHGEMEKRVLIEGQWITVKVKY